MKIKSEKIGIIREDRKKKRVSGSLASMWSVCWDGFWINTTETDHKQHSSPSDPRCQSLMKYLCFSCEDMRGARVFEQRSVAGRLQLCWAVCSWDRQHREKVCTCLVWWKARGWLQGYRSPRGQSQTLSITSFTLFTHSFLSPPPLQTAFPSVFFFFLDRFSNHFLNNCTILVVFKSPKLNTSAEPIDVMLY